MKILKQFKAITLALGCVALAMTTIPANADVVQGHAGTTFIQTPVEIVNGIAQVHHIWDGVVRVSLLGNCTVHGDVVAIPRPDGTYSLAGTCRITSANGGTSLEAVLEGVFTPDPANPGFGDLHYDVKFTGGTGLMANARGRADIDGFAMFTSVDNGKATWLIQGNVATHGHGDSHGHDD
jgi:hypothetical protein